MVNILFYFNTLRGYFSGSCPFQITSVLKVSFLLFNSLSVWISTRRHVWANITFCAWKKTDQSCTSRNKQMRGKLWSCIFYIVHFFLVNYIFLVFWLATWTILPIFPYEFSLFDVDFRFLFQILALCPAYLPLDICHWKHWVIYLSVGA